MIALIKYHTRSFLKTNKYIMPLLAYIIILAMLCSSPLKTVKVVYMISMLVVYLMTVWTGFIYAECEDQITEQIALLKAKTSKQYYISKILFICIWGISFVVIGFVIPLLWKVFCLITHSSSFKDMTAMNVLASLFMNICVAILGGILGYLLHPRVFNNRKIGAIATFSLAVIGIIKGPLLAEFKIPFFKVITWLFPPIYEIITGCDLATKQINMVDILSPCVYAIIYGIILAIINVIVIDKNGF